MIPTVDIALLGANPEGLTMDVAGRIYWCALGTPSRPCDHAPSVHACPCSADLNGDGAVDEVNLGELLMAWGGAGAADLDAGGAIDGADLGVLLRAWSPWG